MLLVLRVALFLFFGFRSEQEENKKERRTGRYSSSRFLFTSTRGLQLQQRNDENE
jgi:hypothetical protein